MDKIQYIYFVIIIYLTLVLGAYIKAKVKNIKGVNIIECSIIPIIIFISLCKVLRETFDNNDLNIKKKIFRSLNLVKVTTIGYPILVSSCVYSLSRKSIRKMNKKSRKLVDLIDCMSKDENSIFGF